MATRSRGSGKVVRRKPVSRGQGGAGLGAVRRAVEVAVAKSAPQSRPAPKVQPGPVRPAERAAVRRHERSPRYRARLRATRSERDAAETARGAAAAARLADVALAKKKRGGLLGELEGVGQIAAISNTLGTALAPHIARLNPLGIPAAALDVIGVDAPARFLERAAKDIVNLPAQAIPSLYLPAAAAVEAAQGDTSRAEELWKGIQTQDPLYAALTGDLKRAARLANEHPGFTALELYGAKGAVGRGAGRTVRGAARLTGSRRLAEIGAVETRPNAVVPGTRLEQERSYSRDLLTKSTPGVGQVARDRRAEAKAARLRREATAAEATNPDRAADLRARANDADPRVMSEGQVFKRVDLYEQAAEGKRRRETAVIDKRLTKILKASGDDEAALSLVAQGIAKADPADLKAYRDGLAAVDLKDPAKQASQTKLIAAIDRSLKRADKDPDHMRKVAEAAQAFAREVDEPLDRVLTGLHVIDPERAARAKLIPYAARHMDAEVVRRKTGEDADGNPVFSQSLAVPDDSIPGGYRTLSNKEIREHMLDPDTGPGRIDPDDISYVSQRPSAKSAGDYYRSSYREPTAGSSRRTERATVEGTFAGDPEAMRARAHRAANMAVTADNFRGFLRETAHLNRDGTAAQFRNFTAAGDAARSLRQSTGIEWQPVRVRPFGGDADQFQAMLDQIADGDDPRLSKDFRASIEQALQGKGGAGPFVLIPRSAAARMEGHLKTLGPGDAARVARGVRTAFTTTVLSTSPGPTFGNAAEGVFRAVLARSFGPVSQTTARRVLRAMDPEDANALLDRAVPGGQIRLMTDRRFLAPEQIESPRLRKAVAGWQASKKAPVAKQAVAAWRLWQTLVFDIVNGKMERFLQIGHLGKQIRDSGLMDDGMLNLSDGAMKQAAQGLKNTRAQAAMAQKIYDAYGKYNGFSPSTRRWIAEYTPFLAWFGSSVNFLTRVLPRDHPTLLAVIASAEQVNEEWRKKQGMDLFMRGDGRLPGRLQGTLDTGGPFGRVKLSYNTPFGVATDPTETTAGLVLPQLRSVVDAFEGRDWKGKRLRNDDGSEYDVLQRTGFALEEFVRATVPAVAVPTRAVRYAKDPSRLASPVRVPPAEEKKGHTVVPAGGNDPLDRINRVRGTDVQRAVPEDVNELLDRIDRYR